MKRIQRQFGVVVFLVLMDCTPMAVDTSVQQSIAADSIKAEPDSEDEREIREWASKGVKRPPVDQLSKPYHPGSLKKLSNEELFRYMGRGKCMEDWEIGNTLKPCLPDGFWKMDSKAAALALADVNRYSTYREKCRLALDDRDGQKPPESGTVAFYDRSARCYNAVDVRYLLRADPNSSYLAYSRAWEQGFVLRNFVHNQPAYDFRYCELSYEDARRVFQTIWWLNRIGPRPDRSEDYGFGGTTSADGQGTVILRSDEGKLLLKTRSFLSIFPVAVIWQGDYGGAVFLKLVEFLFTQALPDRCGKPWKEWEPKHAQDVLTRQTTVPVYTPEETQRLHSCAEKFLGLYAPDESRLSNGIAAHAVAAAGTFAWQDLTNAVEKIHEILPYPEKSLVTTKDFDSEIEWVKTSTSIRDGARKAGELEIQKLNFCNDPDDANVNVLKRAVSLSLRQLKAARDPSALQKWAASREYGCQWALQQLAVTDKKRYVEALEWWLKNSRTEISRQIFEEITRVDSSRALELAKQFPPDEKGDLSVSSFAHLKAVDGIPDEGKRVQTLVQVALDPKSGQAERARAIELLVPPEDPLRYPSRDVDEALLKMMEPKMTGEITSEMLPRAAQALARRGRVEFYPVIERKFCEEAGGFMDNGTLQALAYLTQFDPDKLKPLFQSVVEPHLKRSGRTLNDILWSIWSADLRELKSSLEAMATSGPQDYEGHRANSGGTPRETEGRFHLARKIVSIWNETDLTTRANLLIAFGVEDLGWHASSGETARWKTELKEVSKVLKEEDMRRVKEFLAWCRAGKEGEHPFQQENRRRMVDEAAKCLGLSK
jgi:hypothetical protein